MIDNVCDTETTCEQFGHVCDYVRTYVIMSATVSVQLCDCVVMCIRLCDLRAE